MARKGQALTRVRVITGDAKVVDPPGGLSGAIFSGSAGYRDDSVDSRMSWSSALWLAAGRARRHARRQIKVNVGHKSSWSQVVEIHELLAPLASSRPPCTIFHVPMAITSASLACDGGGVFGSQNVEIKH